MAAIARKLLTLGSLRVLGVMAGTGTIYYSLTAPLEQSIEREIHEDCLDTLRAQGFAIQTSMKSSHDVQEIMNIFQILQNNHEKKREVSKGRIHYDFMQNESFKANSVIKEIIKDCETLTARYLSEAKDIQLSTLQIVNSLPDSEDQIWHRDNKKIGMTLVVPLVDLTENIGTTEIISKSQEFQSPSGMSVIRPIMPKGSYLWMDCRCFHRGCANLDRTQRPILVVRFDHVKSPPPGMSSLETMLWHQIIQIMSKFLLIRREAN